MSGLSAAVTAACAAALIGVLLSGFVTGSGTKKLLRLVLGAFTVCAVILPVVQAAASFRLSAQEFPSYEELTATADEALQKQVVRQTEENLQNTLLAILRQNGIGAEKAEVVLAVSGDSTLIIARVGVYLSPEVSAQAARVRELTEEHLNITPDIITEYP